MKHILVDEWLARQWFVRDKNTKGDLDVIDEVVTRDMYCMRGYAKMYPAPSLVLDVGAHIGTFSVLAKTLWPDVPVIAFEPNPTSFAMLEANTRDFAGVTCVNAAVSYGERPDLVYVDSIKSTGSGFVIERDKAEEAIGWKDGADHMGYRISKIPIAVRTIEEYFQPNPVHCASGILMKLDAELAEVILLNGLSPEIAHKIVAIVGEYHCKGGWNEFLQRVDTGKYPQLRFQSVDADWDKPIGLFRAI
jgi:FkbM family methyltransferase